MILASFTVITMSSKDVPVLGSIRGALIDVAAPIGRGFGSVLSPMKNWFGSVTEYEELKEENEKIREELAVLKAKQLANANAALELETLKEQAGLPTAGDPDIVIAQIATGPFSNFDDNTLMINRGASDGLKVGNPVRTTAGLVGLLETVTDNSAVIRLVTDPENSVSIRTAREGRYGGGHGTGAHRPFLVDFGIPLEVTVEEGETILTSGVNASKYPIDIPIGVVTKVSESRSSMSQELEVEYLVDFNRLTFVQVIRGFPE